MPSSQRTNGKALEFFERAASCYGQQRGLNALPASATIAELLWNQGEKAQAEAMLDGLLAKNSDDARLQTIRSTWQAQSSISIDAQDASKHNAISLGEGQ